MEELKPNSSEANDKIFRKICRNDQKMYFVFFFSALKNIFMHFFFDIQFASVLYLHPPQDSPVQPRLNTA